MIKKKYYMIMHYNHPDSGRPGSEYVIYEEDSPDVPNLKEYHFLRIVSDSEQGVIEEWQHNSKKKKTKLKNTDRYAYNCIIRNNEKFLSNRHMRRFYRLKKLIKKISFVVAAGGK